MKRAEADGRAELRAPGGEAEPCAVLGDFRRKLDSGSHHAAVVAPTPAVHGRVSEWRSAVGEYLQAEALARANYGCRGRSTGGL